MTPEELLNKIRKLQANPSPDKEDWFELLYGNLDTIVEALNDSIESTGM